MGNLASRTEQGRELVRHKWVQVWLEDLKIPAVAEGIMSVVAQFPHTRVSKSDVVYEEICNERYQLDTMFRK